MNKKGFTVVELIVSFSLISLIVALLFQVIFILKDLYTDSGIRTELLTKQAIISEKINDELTNKTLVYANKCGNNCINFAFSDGSMSELSFNRDDNTFKYGDYKTKLISGSIYGNINISTETIVGVSTGRNNSIVKINIPIYHKLFKKEDYGINIAYQYDNRLTAISGLFVSDVLDSEKRVYLIGNSNDIAFTGINYNDPGYFVVDGKGNIIEDDNSVVVSGNVGSEVGKTYTITYTILDSNENIMSTASRNVTVIDSITTFNYNGDIQTFKAPINGLYKIEVWGAQGGTVGSQAVGGKGGYTTGQINLTKNTTLNIYVGGQGSFDKNKSVSGGFNGGGKSGYGSDTSGASGGGASDVRNGNELSNRIIIAGGGGGAGSRNESSDPSNGGAGGGINGLIGSYSTISYNGSPGTSSNGGAHATYNTNITSNPTAGSLGIGGNGGSYSDTYGGGGGGAGYYGGGGGVRYGSGAGGSGYCGSMLNCTTYDGSKSFPSANGSNETGHSGNGVVKITLISVTN